MKTNKYLLFHEEVYLNDNMRDIARRVLSNAENIIYTTHVMEHFNESSSRYGYTESDLHSLINDKEKLSSGSMFEVELNKCINNKNFSWKVSKFVVRYALDDEHDISVVFRPNYNFHTNRYDPKTLKVITAWINKKDDLHNTLDESRYTTEKVFNKEVLCK